MIISAILLGLFAVSGTFFVAYTEKLTRPLIAEQIRIATLKHLNRLVPDDQHDNDLLTDIITVTDPLLGSDEAMTVYRARKNNQAIAAMFTVIAPDGYSGKIRILLGVKYNGELSGVHIIAHKETPGLGDAIDGEKSDWNQQFIGTSLQQPHENKWQVKKDGGEFDQLTGATISPRAVVKAVHKGLLFFKANRDKLFKPNATP